MLIISILIGWVSSYISVSFEVVDVWYNYVYQSNEKLSVKIRYSVVWFFYLILMLFTVSLSSSNIYHEYLLKERRRMELRKDVELHL